MRSAAREHSRTACARLLFAMLRFQVHDIHAGSVLFGFVICVIMCSSSVVRTAIAESLPNRLCRPMASAML